VEHAEVEEGEVVVGLPVASGGDSASCFQPSIRTLDRPAMARLRVARLELPFLAAPDLARCLPRGDRLAAAAALADAGLDLTLAQGFRERARVVAAVGPDLLGPDPPRRQGIDQGQQVAALVLVAGREPHLERRPARVYGEVVAATRPAPLRAPDLVAPFFASTSEASTITRDQSSLSASANCSCNTRIAR